MINYNYLYAVNAWLLIVPQWLCFDWSMGCVPLIKSFTDPRLLCVAALWAVLLLLILYCLFGKDLYYKRYSIHVKNVNSFKDFLLVATLSK